MLFLAAFYLILVVVTLFIPGLIVWFWQKRPVISLIVATLGLVTTLIVPSLIKTFQVLMIYGEGDPQLLAGGISEALVNTGLNLIVFFPLVVFIQWLGRRHFKSKLSKKDIKEVF